jgi:hypothetical protein
MLYIYIYIYIYIYETEIVCLCVCSVTAPERTYVFASNLAYLFRETRVSRNVNPPKKCLEFCVPAKGVLYLGN